MDLGQHADNMPGRNSRGKQAVWTSAMSSFVLKYMADLVAGGTRTSNGFREVHHISCAKALNERFRLHLTAIQVSNHLRKWKKKWTKVNKLKSLNGAVWNEHTCTIELDLEHYTDHVKDHHSDADFLNTPIVHYHEMATICGNGMASGVYVSISSKPLATDVTGNESGNEENNGESDSLATDEIDNETENEKANGASGPLATDVSENEKISEEAAKCITNTSGGSFGDPPGSLPPPKKAKGMHLEQHVDNLEGNNDGGGVVVWTNATSSFVLQFLANLVAGGIRPSHVFKQVHLKSCARALSEHFRVQVNAAQISNHLRKWKTIWAKVNMLKSLSGALWDENTCTIVLDLEHYAAHVKDHHKDADFLNNPIKHYRAMATIFVKDMTSPKPAKSSSESLARDVAENLIENENMERENDLIARCVEEAGMSFTDIDEGNAGDSSGTLPPPPKKAKGYGMITLASTISVQHPSPASDINSSPGPSLLHVAFFYASLYLIAIAQGADKPCGLAFAADQFDPDHPKERASRSSLFNWWFFSMAVGISVAVAVVSYIQENVGWEVGFGMLCVIMLCTFAIFLVGTPTYRLYAPTPGAESPFARLGRSLAALARTSNFVKRHHGHEEEDEDAAAKSEEARGVLRLVPIWAACLAYGVVYAQVMTLFNKQGRTLDRRVFGGLELPPAALQTLGPLSILVFVPIYDRMLVPTLRCATGNPSGLTLLQRVGTGMAVSLAAVSIAGLVEGRRLETAREHGLIDDPGATVPMSWAWLVPQYAMMGVADVFAMVGMQEFFYDQMPGELRSLGLALYLSVTGIGGFISSALISFIDRVTSRDGGDSWFADNLNRAHLDYFYWLLAGISAAELVLYLWFARSYSYNNRRRII